MIFSRLAYYLKVCNAMKHESTHWNLWKANLHLQGDLRCVKSHVKVGTVFLLKFFTKKCTNVHLCNKIYHRIFGKMQFDYARNVAYLINCVSETKLQRSTISWQQVWNKRISGQGERAVLWLLAAILYKRRKSSEWMSRSKSTFQLAYFCGEAFCL